MQSTAVLTLLDTHTAAKGALDPSVQQCEHDLLQSARVADEHPGHVWCGLDPGPERARDVEHDRRRQTRRGNTYRQARSKSCTRRPLPCQPRSRKTHSSPYRRNRRCIAPAELLRRS